MMCPPPPPFLPKAGLEQMTEQSLFSNSHDVSKPLL